MLLSLAAGSVVPLQMVNTLKSGIILQNALETNPSWGIKKSNVVGNHSLNVNQLQLCLPP